MMICTYQGAKFSLPACLLTHKPIYSSATYWSTSMMCEPAANIRRHGGATNKTTEGRVRQRFTLIRDVPRANLERSTVP